MEIEKILNQFDIKAAIVQQLMADAVWIVDDKYILKQSSAANIIKSAELAEKLLAAGIPVAAYMKTKNNDYVCETDGKQYCLMIKLHGEHINPFDRNLSEIGGKLGSVIADLNNALKHITIKTPDDVDFEKEIHDWIEPEIEKAGVKFDDGVISSCHAWLPLYHTLPRQLIHRDLHTDNMLFDGDDFTGFIDFDMSQINARIFDICYLGCTLLVEEYTNELQLLKWQKFFSAVLDGYIVRCPLSDNELAATPMMFVIVEIVFTAFYCKIGQPETAQSCIKFVNWLFHNQEMLKALINLKAS